MEGLKRARNRREEVSRGERYVLLRKSLSPEAFEGTEGWSCSARRSFHHRGTGYENSPGCCAGTGGSNWVFHLSLMSSRLNQLSEIKLRDVGVVMLVFFILTTCQNKH